MMLKVKLGILMFIAALIFTGCSLSKTDVLEEFTSKEEGKYSMRIFSNSRDWEFEVNKVHNSEPGLLNYIEQVIIYSESDKLKSLKALGLEEKVPVILIFDTEKLVFHTNDPEELRKFAKKLEK
ncbi:hypothetical protein [Paenibacillus dakarensis]|uniref:hypothetical protein n=1 Tax=Paenibacillus dakarensis TaxID=1527293 RepID=UPI0006D589FC|nr:hypothetical protein [Paenibacillus dakarensis]